jgi:hypothetical protein
MTKRFLAWFTLQKRFAFAIALLFVFGVLAHFGVLHIPLELFMAPIFGGVALELISGQTTAPGAVITALTPATGDSFTVRNSNPGKRAFLLDAWANNQAAGVFELRSPKLHDNVRAIRDRVTTTDVFPLMVMGLMQGLYPQDVLTPSLSGSAVGGQIEEAAMLIWYEDLAGESARLIDFPTANKRIMDVFEVEVAITPGATGNYSGAAAINASFDTWIANTDYALLGYMVDAKCTSIGFRGPDTGNLRIGGPGMSTQRQFTQEWFLRLSERYGLPLIPIFNSANKAGTLVDIHQNQTGTPVNVTLMCAALAAA